jgi:hypothetical protein
MEFLSTLFVFGGYAFWTLVVIVSIVIMFQVEGDETSGGWAIFTMLITLCALQWMSDLKVFTYIYEHPFAILQWFGFYIAIGIAWSFVKWAWALHKVSEYARELHAEFEKSTEKDKDWSSWVYRNDGLRHYHARIRVSGSLPPRAFENKERLVFWAMYWPWSLIGTFLTDWVKELYDRLVDFFSGLYQRTADYIFRNTPPTKR